VGVTAARFICDVAARGGADPKEYAGRALAIRGDCDTRAAGISPKSPDLKSEIPAVSRKPAAKHPARR
jgi:hypothetical protein